MPANYVTEDREHTRDIRRDMRLYKGGKYGGKTYKGGKYGERIYGGGYTEEEHTGE